MTETKKTALTKRQRQKELEARIVDGLAAIGRGVPVKVAAERAGIAHLTLWRRWKALEGANLQAENEDQLRARVVAKAAAVAEQGLERMLIEISEVKPTLLAPWVDLSARLSGLLNIEETPGRSAGRAIEQLLTALASRGGVVEVGREEKPVRLAARVEVLPPDQTATTLETTEENEHVD